MGAAVVELNDTDFEAQIGGESLVLVDFWAAWCGPCKMIAPTVEAVAGEYTGRVVVAKLNVDESSATATRLGIRSIPTLVLFKGGQEVDKLVGAASRETITRMLDKHL